jgi:hypothetical protein
MRPRNRETDASAGSMTLSILGWVVVALAVGAGTSALLLWAFGWPSLPRSAEFTAANTIELLKIVLAVIAGFGGVVLLSVNHRRQKVAEGDHRLALRQEERERSKLLNERFAAAAEQLAHESDQVRLAGVYALAGLADDWDDGRQKCVEVLIAYLRLADPRESEVVDTIFRTFRERLTSDSPWCDVDYDFTGMKLVDMDFTGFTFRGTVTLDHVVFSGEETTFLDARFDGVLRCHGTEFSAVTTSFSNAIFAAPATFFRARFATTLRLSGTTVDGGKIEFEECLFKGGVYGPELNVVRGALRFDRCVFERMEVLFPFSTFGPLFDHRRWYDVLLGRDEDPGRGGLGIVGCELVDSSVVLDDVFLERGQIVVTDLTLRGGLLRIRPVGAGSFVMLRRIDVQDGEVDVPEQFWKGRAPEDAPRRSERDGHGGVGHDGADVREEL